ncbi:hypothetical protein Rs2_16173 [Raphanus sativus]|nr:hypothetical protein Rs2_16173 [Raphanus sativus]
MPTSLHHHQGLRSGSNYALFDLAKDGKEDGAAGSYATLLRAAMFGPETSEKRDIIGFSASHNIFLGLMIVFALWVRRLVELIWLLVLVPEQVRSCTLLYLFSFCVT